MDEKNIALLGFISGAADYLKDKIDEDSEEIKEIGEIDLEKIKDELSKKLGSSFDGIENKKDDLITAGREVFDDFISSNSMIDDFKDIFNVDFKEKNEQKDEHIINHLMEMLNEPHDEETNEYEQIIASATSDLDKKEEELKNKEVEIFKDDKQDEEIDSLFSEIVAHENGDEVKEETLDDIFEDEGPVVETKSEDDKVLTSGEFKKILEDVLGDALSKLSGSIANKEKEINDESKEEVVNDVVEPETKEVEKTTYKEIVEEPLTNEIDVDEILKEDEPKESHYEMDADGVLKEVSDKPEVIIDVDEELEEPNETIDDVETIESEEEIVEEPKDFLDFLESADLSDEQRQEIKGILDSFSDIENETNNDEDLDVFDKTDDYEIVKEEPVNEEVIEEPEEVLTDDQREFLENSYIDDYNNRSIDELYISNPGVEMFEEKQEEPANEGIVKEPVLDLDKEVTFDELENKDEEENFIDEYISNLMNDLSKESPTDKVEEELRQKEEARNKIYESIKAIYPYLSNGFIKGVYDLKDTLSDDYKEGEKIIILHRLRFEDLEGLRRFVEVIMSHDYLVNVDEDQMIVDTFKEHINADGKILTDIFEVANQAKLLTGEYEGYRILKDEAEASL